MQMFATVISLRSVLLFTLVACCLATNNGTSTATPVSICGAGLEPDRRKCSACREGYWKDLPGQVKCSSCPAQSTSPPGSVGPEACKCKEGFYNESRFTHEPVCSVCPQGAYCNNASSMPQAAPGFYEAAPLQFFACPYSEACVGRGRCMFNREGVDCGACAFGYFQVDSDPKRCETCLDGGSCSDKSWDWPIAALSIMLVITGSAVAYLWAYRNSKCCFHHRRFLPLSHKDSVYDKPAPSFQDNPFRHPPPPPPGARPASGTSGSVPPPPPSRRPPPSPEPEQTSFLAPGGVASVGLPLREQPIAHSEARGHQPPLFQTLEGELPPAPNMPVPPAPQVGQMAAQGSRPPSARSPSPTPAFSSGLRLGSQEVFPANSSLRGSAVATTRAPLLKVQSSEALRAPQSALTPGSAPADSSGATSSSSGRWADVPRLNTNDIPKAESQGATNPSLDSGKPAQIFDIATPTGSPKGGKNDPAFDVATPQGKTWESQQQEQLDAAKLLLAAAKLQLDASGKD